MGAESHLYKNSLGSSLLKLKSWFLGSSLTFPKLYDETLVDINGQLLFDDEYSLFDHQIHLLYESLSPANINSNDLKNTSNLDVHLFHSSTNPSLIT